LTAAGPDLDPVIHVPARLRIMVTLATLPETDSLSFSRLQRLLGLTGGNLITHLRKLEETGYITTVKAPRKGTAISLTHAGRAALERYTATLRGLLDQVAGPSAQTAAESGMVRPPVASHEPDESRGKSRPRS
jgi:DNA-binding MarR family transcriptional regulator